MKLGKILIFVTLIFLVIVFLITTIITQRELINLKKNPNQIAQQETQKLINQVSKLILLPTDEIPIINIVGDAEELKKTQPFFLNAKNGDKVLIYANAKKAILYDSVNNKIIEVAPLSIDNPNIPVLEDVSKPALEIEEGTNSDINSDIDQITE